MNISQRHDETALSLVYGDELDYQEYFDSNLVSVLNNAAKKYPNNGILFIEREATNFLSYSLLKSKAEKMSYALSMLNLPTGSPLIFQLSKNEDFIVAFWACMLVGLIPVFLGVAPTYRHPNAVISKLLNILSALHMPPIICSNEIHSQLRFFSIRNNLSDLMIINIAEFLSRDQLSNVSSLKTTSGANDVAVLLPTSGSTGVPKLVQQTHFAIISRSLAASTFNKFTQKDVSLNWMPLDHVGGIVMFHIHDLFLGINQIHISTPLVLENPLLWLDLISKHKVTATWAPNFAFGLINSTLDNVESKEKNWDLSHLRFILNGGEAISAKTARNFLINLEKYGLRDTTMFPAWGMSETCSGVVYSHNFSVKKTTDDDQFVILGKPIPGFAIRIVDDQGCILPENVIGHLQVKGHGVTIGYCNNPQLNQQVFTEDGWYKTGDKGCINNGLLTLTGRDKDVIIINGANFYSHEIESVVEELDNIDVTYTAACGVNLPGYESEQLVIFIVPKSGSDLTELIKNVRLAVAKKIGINPAIIIPVTSNDIPKTAIGKIQRSLLKNKLEQGEYDNIIDSIESQRKLLKGNEFVKHDARDEFEKDIFAILFKILKHKNILLSHSFYEIGMTSIQSSQLLSEINTKYAISLNAVVLLEKPIIKEFIAYLKEHINNLKLNVGQETSILIEEF